MGHTKMNSGRTLRGVLGAVAAIGFVLAAGFALWLHSMGAPRLVRASELATEGRWDRVAEQIEPYLRWQPDDEQGIILSAQAQQHLGNHLASARRWEQVPEGSVHKTAALLAQ